MDVTINSTLMINRVWDLFDHIPKTLKSLEMCQHLFEDGACVMCGAMPRQVLVSNAFTGIIKITPSHECLHLPDWVDAELRIAALDLFGYLNTAQIRTRKKKIILITCLLYVCSKHYNHTFNFYKQFTEYDVTIKEILFGVNVIERNLCAEKNIYNLDFKFHEMCLELIALDKFEYVDQMRKFHKHLDGCYNKLRSKSVVIACLYILQENYNVDIGLVNFKKPNCFQHIKQSLFAKCMETNIKQHILKEKNIVGFHSLQLTCLRIPYKDYKAGICIYMDPFNVYANNSLVNWERMTFDAWGFMFKSKVFHPNGNVYNANLNISEYINTPGLDLGLSSTF